MSSENLMDSLWYKIKVKAGYCSTNMNIDDLKNYLQQGERAAKIACVAAGIGGKSAEIPAKLQKAAETIANIRGGVDRVQSLCTDIGAFAQISQAVAVLNDWSAHPQRRSDQEAAQAFDMLFGGVSKFASKLPPPLNQYARILEQIQISQFFSNMQKLMDPEGPTPRGRQLHQIMQDL